MGNKLQIPRTIKIGVAGPTKVLKSESVRRIVEKILSKVDSKLNHTDYCLTAISPLSEGYDRILARAIIDYKGSVNHIKSDLRVILKSSGETEDSELLELINSSVSMDTFDRILSDYSEDIKQDYSHTGQLVVNECDFLIGVMSEDSKGDTALVIDYAMYQANKPVFIIDPDAETVKNIDTDYFFKNLVYHDVYNQEKISKKKLLESEESHKSLINKMDSLKLRDDQKTAVKNNIIEQFLKASILAMKYQSRHYLSNNLVYYFSAFTVFIITLQLIFLPFLPQIFLVEVALMITIITLFFLNRINDWHRKWIDYRYLAERLRAAAIFSMTGLECKIFDHLPHQQASSDWILNAYQSVYQKQLDISCPELGFDEIKNFVLDNWIINQKKYYNKRSLKDGEKDKNTLVVIYGAFAIALVAGIIHSLSIYFFNSHESLIFNVTTLLAIVSPAVAASAAGIRVQHEYLRTSKRYSHMASYLQGMEHKIRKLDGDKEKLIELLEEANEMMLREHQDWRTIFSARGPEL